MNRKIHLILLTTFVALVLVAGALGAQDATETPEATPQPDAEATSEATPEATAEATALPEMTAPHFYDAPVTARGSYGNPINARAFELINVQGMFQTPGVLVVDMTDEGLNFGQYENATDNGLLVLGTLMPYTQVAQSLEETLGADFDVEAFMDYETWPIIAATHIHPLHDLMNADPLAGNPGAYAGQPVAVEGKLGETRGGDAFTIIEEDLINDDIVLVVNASGAPLNFVPLVGKNVLVYGTAQNVAYLRTSFSADYDLPLDTLLFSDYDDAMPVILAAGVTNLDAVTSIQAIQEDAALFENRPLSLLGGIQELIGDNGLLLSADGLFQDFNLPVVITSHVSLPLADYVGQNVTVRGTVRALDAAMLQQEYGVTIDPNAFAPYIGRPVFVAEQVIPAEISEG